MSHALSVKCLSMKGYFPDKSIPGAQFRAAPCFLAANERRGAVGACILRSRGQAANDIVAVWATEVFENDRTHELGARSPCYPSRYSALSCASSRHSGCVRAGSRKGCHRLTPAPPMRRSGHSRHSLYCSATTRDELALRDIAWHASPGTTSIYRFKDEPFAGAIHPAWSRSGCGCCGRPRWAG